MLLIKTWDLQHCNGLLTWAVLYDKAIDIGGKFTSEGALYLRKSFLAGALTQVYRT